MSMSEDKLEKVIIKKLMFIGHVDLSETLTIDSNSLFFILQNLKICTPMSLQFKFGTKM